MRNLKKILALVLALIMSLSLMATAGASSFPDVDDENPYATAIEVLDALKVFQGYKEDGTFRPTETLNRAQAAVLVYRVATGDVEDKYLDNYTFMQQSKFEDLDGYNWAKGYINYCQNAKIVVGTSATTFEPGKKVTGYELLVMLLRTLGYGQAGEFADPKGWELQTAAIAEREGILKNVTKGDLGAAAPRQMVAEILFRGLLTSKVEYSPLTPNGYTKNGKTLGQEQFGLEQITGVIMANQWAALDDDTVMKPDTTRMLVTKVQEVGATAEVGKNVVLDSATDLEAVGMSYVAYVAGKTADKQTLTLAEGDNTVGFNEGKSINTGSSDQGYKALKDLGVALDSKTEYYIDYDQNWTNDAVSDFLIRYTIDVDSINTAADRKYITADQKADWIEWLDKCVKDNTARPSKNDSNVIVTYERTIRPGQAITEIDQEIMKEIFYSADRDREFNVDPYAYIRGEVFVGTATTKDVSDTMSWVQFKAEYFNDSKTYVKFDEAKNGESVRTIDNNGDGVADYALKVTYTMDKVVGTYKDALLLNTQAFSNYSAEKNTLIAPELEQGDVVVYSLIDKQLNVRKAESDTDTIQTKNWQKITVTTAGGETYGQSGIANKTGMDELIRNMNEKTEYIMYQDLFGFVRAYELAQGSKYALLTEMYTTGNYNGNYVRTGSLIAEMKVGEGDKEEHPVANPNGNVFYNTYAWTTMAANRYNANNYNFLQPAIAHLGQLVGVNKNQYMGSTATASSTNTYADWNRTVWQMAPLTGDATNYGVFDYGQVSGKYYGTGTANPVMHSFSFTNVAAYSMDGDNVLLNTASKLAIDTKGEQIYYDTTVGVNSAKTTRTDWVNAKIKAGSTLTAAQLAVDFDDMVNGTNIGGRNAGLEYKMYPVYAEDYIQLTAQNVAANTRHYNINSTYGTKYNTASNAYVDATTETEFYIVMPGEVMYKVGYAELPTIKAEEVRAAYAVAKNTAKDINTEDYWVADVIVIEVNKLSNAYDSISLMYYNPYETVGSTRYVESLNNQWRTSQPEYASKAMMTVVPKVTDVTGAYVTWGNTPWSAASYGFYKLYDTTLEAEGTTLAGNIEGITKDFNSWGIYAGKVKRTDGPVRSGYLDVDTTKTGSGESNLIQINYGDYTVPFYRVDEAASGVTSAREIALNHILDWSEVKNDDEIIWVYNNAQNRVAFVIDVHTVTDSNGNITAQAPNWLKKQVGSTTDGLWEKIVEEQKTVPTIGNTTLTIKAYSGNPATGAWLQDIQIPLTLGNTTQVQPSQINVVPGYTLNTIYYRNSTGALVTLANVGAPVTFWQNTTGTQTAKSATGAAAGTVNSWKLDFAPVTAGSTAQPLYADFTKNAYQVKVVKSANSAAPVNNGYAVNGVPSGAGVTWTNNTDFGTFSMGDKIDINFTPTAGYTYTYTISGNGDGDVAATQNASTSGKISFTIDPKATPKAGDIVVTIIEHDVSMTTITTATNANATVTYTSNDYTTGTALVSGGKVLANTAVNFSAAATAGNVVTKVQYKEFNKAAVTVGTSAGDYVIPAAATAAGTSVEVIVTTASTTAATVTIANTSGAAGYMWVDPSAKKTVASGNTIDVQPASGVLYLEVEPGTMVNTSGGTPASTDGTNWTITGIIAATTVTLTKGGIVTNATTVNTALTNDGGWAAQVIPFLSSAPTVTQVGTRELNISVTIDKPFSKNDTQNFPGFGANGAAVITGANVNNPNFPLNAEKFGFYAFQVSDGTNTYEVVMVVAPGMTNGTFNKTIAGQQYTIHYTNVTF